MNIERNEEDRRYDESAAQDSRTLDSSVLEQPVRSLRRKEAVRVAPDDELLATVQRMVEKRQGCAVVVEDGKVVGIFTERDALTRVLAKGLAASQAKVKDVMTRDPARISLDDTLGHALHQMSVGGYRHVPVVDRDGEPAGVISQREAVQFLVGFFPEEVINQPPRSITQAPPRSQHGG
jgi:CBS domain-containing protein